MNFESKKKKKTCNHKIIINSNKVLLYVFALRVWKIISFEIWWLFLTKTLKKEDRSAEFFWKITWLSSSKSQNLVTP